MYSTLSCSTKTWPTTVRRGFGVLGFWRDYHYEVPVLCAMYVATYILLTRLAMPPIVFCAYIIVLTMACAQDTEIKEQLTSFLSDPSL